MILGDHFGQGVYLRHRYALPPSRRNAEPFEPAQHDVEPAVVERLSVRDDSAHPMETLAAARVARIASWLAAPSR